MAAQILAVGTTQADSADITIAPGAVLTVGLKGQISSGASNASVSIYLKDDAGAYNFVDELAYPSRQALVIVGPGIYRFSRNSNGATCGVYSG
jgi:hypothetical protein